MGVLGLVAWLCFVPLATAWANDTKSAEQAAALPPDYALINQTYMDCKAKPNNIYYNCGCIAVVYADKIKAMEENAKQLNQPLTRWEQMEALGKSYTQCANLNSVAVHAYNRCVDWAVMARDDFKEFSSCFA